jgi:hypothetical protein
MKVSTTFKGNHFRKRFDEIPVFTEQSAALLVEIPTGINHRMTAALLDYDIVKNRQKNHSKSENRV